MRGLCLVWGGASLLALGLFTAGCGDDASSAPPAGSAATTGGGAGDATAGGDLGGASPGGGGSGAVGGRLDGWAGGLASTGGGGAASALCPLDMAWVDAGPIEGVCMDLYEAPNHAGELPLVMYSMPESEAWCAARGKELCQDDVWTVACEGPQGHDYPYGDAHAAGVCNDDELWRAFNQSALNLWPPSASSPSVESLDELLNAARAVSASAKIAADHVEWLYQAEPAGSNPGCAGDAGVYDLIGNVEEWTRRADGGDGSLFTGNLKGRFWAESRTCQQGIKIHADPFRFYEIGFRCCAEPTW